ncbi:retrotransposon hot spot (RHS) protein [Trypanosoma cruzi]|nr:retrotransposon hot spot (RHS) protein [Trypanosoma cruzi]
MATVGGHHTVTSTVRQFTECLAAYFNGWEELSRDLSWEMIYVQHAASTPMNDWQGCDVVDSNNVGDDESRELRCSGRKRCTSTWQQYRRTMPEGTKLSEVRDNHRNMRTN